MTKKSFLFQLSLVAMLLVGCKSKEEPIQEQAYQFKGDTVTVLDETLLKEKVKFSTITEELVPREVSTAGTIQAIPTQYAYIAPPFSGRVVRSHIKLGQKVSKNTPLFEIVSSDFTSAQKEFLQAESALELAKNNLNRQKDLKDNGVSSQKELEQATNELFVAEKEYENAFSALQVYQTNPIGMKLGEPLIVRSPIQGNVIEDKLVTGQYLSGEEDKVAVVADLSKVWIVAQVKEKDIRYIKVGNTLRIDVAALPGESLVGEVYHIDEAIDIETRSIRVLSVCDNREGHLKLGMYGTVHFSDEPSPHLVVSDKALLQGEDYTYLFVKKGDKTFVRVPIEVEMSKNGSSAVVGDIKAGDVVVSEGGYYFK